MKMFLRRADKNENRNGVLENIKAEPKIKALLYVAKICQTVYYILIAGAFALVAYNMYRSFNRVNSDNIYSDLLSKLASPLVVAGIGFGILLAGNIIQVVAYFMIDKRLTQTAAEHGVQEKFPTGKDVTKWKVLCQLCCVAMLLFTIIAYAFLNSNYVVAIVMAVCMLLSAFAARLSNKRADVLQNRRVGNITEAVIYARNGFSAETENNNSDF